MTKRRKGGSGREGLIMGEDRLLQETREQKLEHRDRRPDALGELGVLSDELICAILDRLTPRDLGRLSCVSSFMYTFCNEEPLWMSMCLRNPGLLEYRSSWKKTTLHQQNFLTAAVEPSENPLKFDGFYSLFLYRRWYRCFTTLDAFYKDDGYLERRETSGGDFCLDYSKPVLLTDLAKTWPARKTWTIDQFLQKYGETTFRISQRSSRKITMKLKDYVSYISCQHDEDPLYIFDEKFGESAPSLLEDYTVPIIFREDFFDVLDEEQRPPFRWLIIGPERSGASWHVDPALTSAWNTLLVGRKRWALYPPGKVPAGVTVHVNEEDGDVDIETLSSLQWWLDVYPFLAEKDKPIECTQLPGETIFVPSGWWHCVLNLETTIAITQNFVNESNFDFVCIDFCPGHLHKGVARAGWLAIDNQDVARSSTSEDDGELGNHNGFQKFDFSYDTDFLSKFVSEEADHYTFTWGEGSCVGQREFREWLHRLWVVRPELRTLVWKGACLALKADAWLGRIMEICASNNLPLPSEDEKLPVGTGSNPVWNTVGRGFLEGFLAVNAFGRSSGVVIAWNDTVFSKVETWSGQAMAAVKLKRMSNDFEMVIVSVYGSTNTRRGLWGELAEVVSNFQGSPMLFGGDFNVTLEATDRPNDKGGLDPDSADFWSFIADADLQEMGPVDCVYTWSMVGGMMKSRLDRFLCSVEVAESSLTQM